jgi:hypothetical protein
MLNCANKKQRKEGEYDDHHQLQNKEKERERAETGISFLKDGNKKERSSFICLYYFLINYQLQ